MVTAVDSRSKCSYCSTRAPVARAASTKFEGSTAADHHTKPTYDDPDTGPIGARKRKR